MSRYRFWGSIAFIPMVAVLLALAGCGGEEKKAGKMSKGDLANLQETDGGSKGKASGERTAVDAKGTGTLKGKVTFAGATVPERKDLSDQMKAQADKDHCLKGDTKSQEWVVGADKGVANVVVFLRAPDGKFFNVPDNLRHRTDTVIVEQPFCAFQPHVSAVNPTTWDPQAKKQVKTGQVLKFINNAPINHNTTVAGDTFLNPRKNNIIPAKKGDKVEELIYEAKPCKETQSSREDLLTVQCDIHKWMNARVAVFDHPYYAVTKADGTYEIKDAPAEAEVDVVIWHESMGDSLNKGHKEKVTLKPGDNTKDFTVGQ
jgi:hypothetical protein